MGTRKDAAQPALPRVVELLRVSGQGQADRDTPEDQRRALDKLRASFPCTVVERIDSGAIKAVSGAADLNERPDLRRLAELARARAFDELRVRHLDRLTRHTDPRERFAIFGMVQDAGAVIRDASGHIIDPASEIGEVDYFLQTWMSAKERRRIIERTVSARQRLSAAGRPMTTIPYGRTYDFAAGTWGLDEEKAGTYRRIFLETIEGVSLHRLADKLNQEGIPAPKGGTWEASSLRRMMRNTSAIGRMTSYGHPITCPAVVDEQTWHAAHEAMKRGRTRSGPPAKHEALLRKLATCSECGSTMYVAPGGNRADPALYYSCARNKKREAEGGCRAWHRVELVDAAMMKALRDLLDDPKRLARELARGGAVAENGDEAREAREELAALDQREEKLVRLLTKAMVSENVYERQAKEIARLRSAATERVSASEGRAEAAARAKARAADIAAAVAVLRKSIASGATFAQWRKLVAGLFPRRPGTWLRVRPDGQLDANGLVRLTPETGNDAPGKVGTDTSASPSP